MKRPGPHEFLLGNRAVTLSLLGAGCFAAYESATAGISWLCPALLFLLGARAGRARKKVVEYQSWAHSWGTIAGNSSKRPARNLTGLRPLRRVLGLAVWGITLAWLYQHLAEIDSANYRTVGAAFLALTALGARRLLRSLKASPGRARVSPAPGGKDWPVARVLLGVPCSSPTPSQIDLPDYCRALLAPPRSAATATSTR